MRSVSHFIKHPDDLLIASLKKYGGWLPDYLFLKIRYRHEMGCKLNLESPRKFTEKIQWLKIHSHNPEFTTMVDKYAVKEFVANKIGNKYIIPTLGVWNSFDDIDFNSLPDKFVLKTTHGGGSTGVVVVKGKDSMDKQKAKKMLEWSLNRNGFAANREWPYKNVKRKILAEEYIENPERRDLTDFKIFCFNGIPKYVQVIQDRSTKETIDFYDTDWNLQGFIGLNPSAVHADKCMHKPDNFREMLDIASKLSTGIPFLRVDLYNIAGKIYFGELTFYPASGFGKFTPSEWDLKLGEMLHLP